MYVLFEESGQFKTATILSEADSTLQIENVSGKRSKIKRANVIFTFNDVLPETILETAKQLASEIDIEFLWEMSPKEIFNLERISTEYYGDKVSSAEKASLLLCLHDHPIYFHRKGKGLYQAAPEEILKAALLAQEKKRQQAQQQEDWANALVRGEIPEEIREVLPSYLHHPDKNTLAWKAFNQALETTGMHTAEFLLKLNVFPHALAVHRAKFFGQYFPKGTEHPPLDIPAYEPLPRAEVTAYSVDDISTTEIDDAFSVQKINETDYIFGIHIACPALVVDRDSPLDKVARQRMSTVYFPGNKVPMQSEALIKAFSLNAGNYVPSLSLYITANIQTGEILHEETKLEEVFIQENLRTNYLDPLLTTEALENPQIDIPYGELFRPMWALAQHLSKAREEIRGKPESNNRVEYMFSLEGADDDPNSTLVLTPRQRNAPLDLMVAEFMILCNSRWAKLLDDLGLPGIFRSQQNSRVRMSTHALIHEAIGVPHYAWTTSPLRRYVDLFNQRQLIAAVKHGISARLVAPYKPKDNDIFVIISNFEACHNSYSDFQNKMQRYWCLRHLEQNNISRTTARFIRDELVQLDNIPLNITMPELVELEKDTRVELDILSIDLYNLSVETRLVQILDN